MKNTNAEQITSEMIQELQKLKKDISGNQNEFATEYGCDASKVSRVLSGKLFDPHMIEALIVFRDKLVKRNISTIYSLTEKLKRGGS
jgi:hypothetical protein